MNGAEVWILDLGSQYTQLIARKTRTLGHEAMVLSLAEAKHLWGLGTRPCGLVLSGGPGLLKNDDTDYSLFFSEESLPVLGICYGMQVMGKLFGGRVCRGAVGEYGLSRVKWAYGYRGDFPFAQEFSVWMSHSDHLESPPGEFQIILESQNSMVAAMAHVKRPLLGLQFHPEVNHTEHGTEILEFFYTQVAGLTPQWSPGRMLQRAREVISSHRDGRVLCAFSGGVDSLVAATLAHEQLGEDLVCVFVDTGLVRPQDLHHMAQLQKETPLNIHVIEAHDEFLCRLKGVVDPEKKRKIIGHTFIEVFESWICGQSFTHLLQGTLYPDVIESSNPQKSATIKGHHNVGGLPEKMKLKLMEPLRWLFKDEVRTIGKELGLRPQWLSRHPFPGPGLGVRILGELTPLAIKQVRQSDQILFEELQSHGLYLATWQALTVLLPIETVGIKGDRRAYERVICLRMVDSSDGMTAKWSELPHSFLALVSRRITNEVEGITRVVYDITSKPPGTIEWE